MMAPEPRDLEGCLARLVADNPDARAMIDSHAGRTASMSRRDFVDRVAALSADLVGAGLRRGHSVGVWLPNWSNVLVWQVAVASLGARVVGINTRYNVDEVTHVLDLARPAIVAVAHEFVGLDLVGRLRSAVRETTAAAPQVAVVSGPFGPAPADVAAYDVGNGAWTPSATTPETAPVDLPPDRHSDELAVAFTTSGSSGTPKLAAHRQSAAVAHGLADAAALRLSPADVVACVLPLSGVFGFSTAMAAFTAGATCLLEPVFDEALIVRHMAEFKVTHLVAGDDMLARLQAAWRSRPVDLSAWRWCGAADFIGKVPELSAWAAEEFGTAMVAVYGSSELMALTAIRRDDEPDTRRLTPGGHLVSPAIDVRVCDPVSGSTVRDGETGELQFRGPNVVDDYLGAPSVVAEAFTGDGWFRTGDLGRITGPGEIEFACRMGDVLRLRGFLVDPAEIEQRLVQHQAVQVARVVGSEDPETRVVAFVVLIDGAEATPADLRAWCQATLATFKVPAEIRVIDAMPTTSGTNGTKIRTAVLRDWARGLTSQTRGEQR